MRMEDDPHYQPDPDDEYETVPCDEPAPFSGFYLGYPEPAYWCAKHFALYAPDCPDQD